MARPRISVRRRLTYALIVLLASLFVAELALRWVGYQPKFQPPVVEGPPGEPPWLCPDTYFSVCDATLGFRNRSHGEYCARHIEGQPMVTTDRFGYRTGYGWRHDADTPIVLFVGDSFTFCSEVNDDQTGASEVAKLLEDEFDVRVLNAGVRGYSTVQCKRMMAECFHRYGNKIRLVVYTYCENDLEDNIVPNTSFPVKRPLVVRDADTGNLHQTDVEDLAVPPGESFQHWRPASAPKRRSRLTVWLQTHCVLFRHSLLAWNRCRPLRLPQEDEPVAADDIPRWHRWALEHHGRDAIRQLLSEMQGMCDRHGAAFLATMTDIDEENGISRSPFPNDCVTAGVQYQSVDDVAFAPDNRPYIAKYINGEWDGHFNADGTRAYARALIPAIRPLLRSVLSDGSGSSPREGRKP